MATRTIKQWTINVRTTIPVPEDLQDMDDEDAVADGVNLMAVEQRINDELPDGYYCKIEDRGDQMVEDVN